jgi:hypothetical protein
MVVPLAHRNSETTQLAKAQSGQKKDCLECYVMIKII